MFSIITMMFDQYLSVQVFNMKWPFLSCSSSSSQGEPISSVVVRCFTEALPENRYPIGYIST